MINKQTAALKLALEFFEQGNFAYPTSLADAIREALADQPAQQESPSTQRWNIERDGDALLVCDGLHDKHEPCEYKRYVPEPAQQQEPVALRQLVEQALKGDLSGDSDADLALILKARKELAGIASPPASKPLTRDQVKEIMKEAGYEGASAQHRADFINGIRHGEAAHGIKGDA